MKSLTMVLLNSGIFLCGELIGGNKLINPRTFSLIEDMEIGPDKQRRPVQKMQMAPLPGLPDFIMIRNQEPAYPIPAGNTNMYALYERVTTPPKLEAAVPPELIVPEVMQ